MTTSFPSSSASSPSSAVSRPDFATEDDWRAFSQWPRPPSFITSSSSTSHQHDDEKRSLQPQAQQQQRWKSVMAIVRQAYNSATPMLMWSHDASKSGSTSSWSLHDMATGRVIPIAREWPIHGLHDAIELRHRYDGGGDGGDGAAADGGRTYGPAPLSNWQFYKRGRHPLAHAYTASRASWTDEQWKHIVRTNHIGDVTVTTDEAAMQMANCKVINCVASLLNQLLISEAVSHDTTKYGYVSESAAIGTAAVYRWCTALDESLHPVLTRVLDVGSLAEGTAGSFPPRQLLPREETRGGDTVHVWSSHRDRRRAGPVISLGNGLLAILPTERYTNEIMIWSTHRALHGVVHTPPPEIHYPHHDTIRILEATSAAAIVPGPKAPAWIPITSVTHFGSGVMGVFSSDHYTSRWRFTDMMHVTRMDKAHAGPVYAHPTMTKSIMDRNTGEHALVDVPVSLPLPYTSGSTAMPWISEEKSKDGKPIVFQREVVQCSLTGDIAATNMGRTSIRAYRITLNAATNRYEMVSYGIGIPLPDRCVPRLYGWIGTNHIMVEFRGPHRLNIFNVITGNLTGYIDDVDRVLQLPTPSWSYVQQFGVAAYQSYFVERDQRVITTSLTGEIHCWRVDDLIKPSSSSSSATPPSAASTSSSSSTSATATASSSLQNSESDSDDKQSSEAATKVPNHTGSTARCWTIAATKDSSRHGIYLPCLHVVGPHWLVVYHESRNTAPPTIRVYHIDTAALTYEYHPQGNWSMTAMVQMKPFDNELDEMHATVEWLYDTVGGGGAHGLIADELLVIITNYLF